MARARTKEREMLGPLGCSLAPIIMTMVIAVIIMYAFGVFK